MSEIITDLSAITSKAPKASTPERATGLIPSKTNKDKLWIIIF